MSDGDAFRRFLERATEDPITGGSGQPERGPGAHERRRLAIGLVAAAVILTAVIGFAVRRSDQRSAAGPAGPEPTAVLVLSAAEIPVGADDGAIVHPSVGPDLRVERIGSGSIEAAAGGRRFLAGGQQRDDHAIVTLTGPTVASLATGDTGGLGVRFVPLVDLAARTTPAGRNIVTFAEIASDDTDEHLVLGVSLHLDPEIGPYLAGAIAGVSFLHVLTEDEQPSLDAGSAVELTLRWADGVGTVELDGDPIEQLALEGTPVTWTDAARLSIGGSATFGGGYFTMHEDALASVELGLGDAGG